MGWWLLLLLALVQGLTEFWPVSSSAHLVLVPHLLGTDDQQRSIDVALHLGTLLALLAYYRRECLGMLRAAGSRLRALGSRPGAVASQPGTGLPAADENDRPAATGEYDRDQWRWLLLLLLASVPLALAGGWVAQMDIPRTPALVGWTSLIFGILLGAAALRRRFAVQRVADIGWMQALLVGAFQVLALVPGVSRSGIVLTACLLLGLLPGLGVRFALLLGIPAIAGAVLWELMHLPGAIWAHGDFWLAAAMSAAVGLAGIGALVWVVERLGVWPFVVYRLLLSAAILLFYAGV